VNKSYSGPQLTLPHDSSISNATLYDCWRGVPLDAVHKRVTKREGAKGVSHSAESVTTVSFDVEALGYGCVLRSNNASGDGTPLGNFLAAMRALSSTPLESYSRQFNYLMQSMTPHPRTTPAPPGAAPRGMARVQRHDGFDFAVRSVADQVSDALGSDVQFYWEQRPMIEHAMRVPINEFLIDVTPVTNQAFEQFVGTSGYVPVDTHNFLKNWNQSGDNVKTWKCPKSLVNKPVAYVSMTEARRYCEWAGKRLPTEWEYQYTAQGPNGTRLFPWGDDANCTACRPAVVVGRQIPGAADVGAHSPMGDSVFEVADLVGNVWQFTGEFTDAHSRGAVVRGSSNWAPGFNGSVGSHWYFPEAPLLTQHNKYFLMSDSYDRVGTVGFRCAMDVEPTPSATGTVSARLGKGTVSMQWGGPPRAYTTLSTPKVKHYFLRAWHASHKRKACWTKS
jgi:iron(II)-dependent oxidoreductase